jgi:hypothetical protein
MSKNPPMRLQVSMMLEVFIDHHHAIRTFIDTIDKIGIEQVLDLGIVVEPMDIPLIATNNQYYGMDARHQKHYELHTDSKHWILKTTNTKTKHELLEQIGEELSIDMYVKQVLK